MSDSWMPTKVGPATQDSRDVPPGLYSQNAAASETVAADQHLYDLTTENLFNVWAVSDEIPNRHAEIEGEFYRIPTGGALTNSPLNIAYGTQSGTQEIVNESNLNRSIFGLSGNNSAHFYLTNAQIFIDTVFQRLTVAVVGTSTQGNLRKQMRLLDVVSKQQLAGSLVDVPGSVNNLGSLFFLTYPMDSSFAQPRWLSALQRGQNSPLEEDAIKDAFTNIRRMANERKIEELNRAFESAIPSLMRIEAMIAMLRYSFVHRSELSSWNRLNRRIRDEITNRGENATRLLRGLDVD